MPRGRPKKIQEEQSVAPVEETVVAEKAVPEIKTDNISVKKETLDALLAKVDSLEKRDLENQEKLKLLYSVADKGRVFNYENSKSEKKPTKVKLSAYDDKLIVGWRTIKDHLIKNPSTGTVVGEEQEYEILLLDKSGQTTKATINGYARFSDARYTERVECEVIGKKEDYNGVITFDLILPDGKQISLDSKFIN